MISFRGRHLGTNGCFSFATFYLHLNVCPVFFSSNRDQISLVVHPYCKTECLYLRSLRHSSICTFVPLEPKAYQAIITLKKSGPSFNWLRVNQLATVEYYYGFGFGNGLYAGEYYYGRETTTASREF